MDEGFCLFAVYEEFDFGVALVCELGILGVDPGQVEIMHRIDESFFSIISTIVQCDGLNYLIFH